MLFFVHLLTSTSILDFIILNPFLVFVTFASMADIYRNNPILITFYSSTAILICINSYYIITNINLSFKIFLHNFTVVGTYLIQVNFAYYLKSGNYSHFFFTYFVLFTLGLLLLHIEISYYLQFIGERTYNYLLVPIFFFKKILEFKN